MITENLSTLKIHKLTQAQYDREVANGTIDETALYLTPDEKTVGKSVEGETFIVDDIEIIAGNGAEVFNDYSYNIATGDYSHAEGAVVHAVGNYSHAEGLSTIASGDCSHAEGNLTAAEGACSHAEGECTVASGSCQHVQGKYNIVDSNFAHIVGNGRVGNLSNAHTIDWDGNAWYAGGITVNGRINGLALSPINDTEVANKKYVDDNISNIIEQIEQLQEDKANKSGLTLGVHTDGLVYLFIDGVPHGNGLDIQASVVEGDVFGYVDENNVIVLNGSLADGTYTIKYEMEDGSVVEIGDLVLDTNVYYTVTNTLTQCTTNNSATQAIEGESYSATITANSGYELKSVVVTMGGVDISTDAVSGGVINITEVTASVVITATATAIVTEEIFVNLIPTLTDTDLITIYNGVGYKENTRISISSVSTSNPTGEKTENNTTLTGLIPVSDGDVFHFRGIDTLGTAGAGSDYDGTFWCYGASGELLTTKQTYIANVAPNAISVDENDDFTITINSSWLVAGTAYVRFNVGRVIGEFIMSRNQFITA